MSDWDFLYDMNKRGSSTEEIFDAMANGYDQSQICPNIQQNKPLLKNKIAFLDFEFGAIYGSWYRDFLITEAGILIYDIRNDTFQLGEIIFHPNFNLVARERIKIKEGKYKTLEYVVNRYKDEAFKYDKNFKLSNKEKKNIKNIWNSEFKNKLKLFFKNTLKNIDDIYVFGGSEDIKFLDRYAIKYKNIIDIQTLLHNMNKEKYPLDIQDKLNIEKNKKYSLDILIDTFEFNNIINNGKINFSKYIYNLPPQKDYFSYKLENLKAHSASGDCLRLFSIYKELIEDSMFNKT